MPKIYARVTSLNNAAGRSDYISNPDRQDHIYNHEKSRDFDWKEYAEFEKNNQKSSVKNNEARELVVGLPNDISELPADERAEIGHALAKQILGEDRDYEFAFHFNKEMTNFHMHLIFSEREVAPEPEIKRYKRDMWYDKETNRMAKANAPGAELRYKKGQHMKNKDGSLRYDIQPFTKKDIKFKSKKWITQDVKEQIQQTLGEYGYQLELFDPNNEIKQRKLYKGATPEYLEYAQTWNLNAKEINSEHKHRLETFTAEKNKLISLHEKYDHKRYLKLNSKLLKTPSVKAEIQDLNQQRAEVIAEKENIIEKYQIKIDPKTPMSQFIEFLESMVEHIMSMFATSRDNLYRQAGTIEKVQKLVRAEKEKQEKQQKEHKPPVKEENRASEGLNSRLDDLFAEQRGNTPKSKMRSQRPKLDEFER